VADLIAVDEAVLTTSLGASQARHLLALARGIDDRPVEPEREAKSIGHEETFASNATDPSEMRTHLVRLSDAVASRLRKAGVGARTLTLKVAFRRRVPHDHPVHDRPRTDGPGDTIVAMLQPILDAIDPSPGVRLVGVSGSNLGAVHHQLTLDDAALNMPVHGAREAALDEIRERFGTDAIGRRAPFRAARSAT